MDLLGLISESIGTLGLNKLRTALATLGIVIGVGAVIALVSLGQASQSAVSNQIQSLGSNLLTITPTGQTTTGGVRSAAGVGTTLTLEDAQAIKTSNQITAVSNISPEVARRAQVTTGRNNTNTQIIGVTPTYTEVHKISLSAGNFISQRDGDALSKVAVVGPQVVTDLFGSGSTPIGQNIRISGLSFRIVGITASKGGTGFANQDDLVFIPLSVAQKQLLGINFITSISIEAKDANRVTDAENQIGYLLLARHHLTDPTQADFSMISQNDIIGAASQITGTLTALITGIAAISLLVGGIGIMNIMLVTVTERTREIGLRKALGAKKRIIVTQFLVEATILTFTGGLIGMLAGIAISFFITKLINLPFAISVSSVILAIGVSGAIGILFGWYPAKKASDLQPIEALRYE